MEEKKKKTKEEPTRILVCDDDPAYRKLIRTYLHSAAKSEFVLIEAGRKAEIQHALDTSSGFDLVLMDIQMPEKSGMEWLEEIVKKQIAPVVMLTGFGSEEIAVQSLHAGAIDYIPKDLLTKDRLVGTVKAALETWKRKRLEEEKRRLVEELEAKNTELERFTYTISHDLKSPLFTIRSFVEMLRTDLEQNEREKVETDLKYIEYGAARMSHLLDDTLELSRIGRVANPPEEVPFGELVQAAVEQTAGEIKSSGVEVAVAGDFPTVHVDRVRIEEVLVNLITNSIKYRGEQPHPKIEIGHRVEDDSEIVFFVKDNGIGIAPEQQEKVFGLFYKLDKNIKGTGAGLAIVKRIIEVHGGRIWIEPEKGKGCTVCFTLPLAQEQKK